VRLAVRLADCCMQLAVELLWTCCATSCPTCCETCCLSYNLLWTSVVVLLLAFDLLLICRTACCATNQQRIEASGVGRWVNLAVRMICGPEAGIQLVARRRRHGYSCCAAAVLRSWSCVSWSSSTSRHPATNCITTT